MYEGCGGSASEDAAGTSLLHDDCSGAWGLEVAGHTSITTGTLNRALVHRWAASIKGELGAPGWVARMGLRRERVGAWAKLKAGGTNACSTMWRGRFEAAGW